MRKLSRSKNQQIDPGRRQALGMLTSAVVGGMAFDPVKMLMNGIVDGLMAKAQADTMPFSKPPRNYVYIAFPYGPNRFHWDLPLAPYSSLTDPNYVYPTASLNAGISNRFAGTTSVTPAYSSTVVTAPLSGVKLRMPYMWGWTIPTSSGTWVPMANLLDNMIFMRGITSLDGHVDSQLIQTHPLAGAPSIDGAVADRGTNPVPALALAGSPNIFASATGVGNLRVQNLTVAANPLQQILTPFDRTQDGLSTTYLSRRDAMSTVMQQALTSLGLAAQSGNPGANILWNSRGTAEAMIKKGIGNVSTVYSTLLTKYQTLVALCSNEHLNGRAVGITDRNLSKSNFSDALLYNTGNGESISTNLAQIFQYSSTNAANSTLLQGLSESFAIAEYLLMNNYSNAITAGCTAVSGLSVPGYTPWGWDEHGAGTPISIIVNSMAFRGVAACLLEFTKQLQSANVFEETVIHLGGEFSRAPRADQHGFDHSPNGNAISLISGAIKAPCVIGNTQVSTDPQHPGNFGIGDVMKLDGGMKVPTPGNQSSTIASLLRVNAPQPNNSSMLLDNGTSIIPVVELAKNTGES